MRTPIIYNCAPLYEGDYCFSLTLPRHACFWGPASWGQLLRGSLRGGLDFLAIPRAHAAGTPWNVLCEYP